MRNLRLELVDGSGNTPVVEMSECVRHDAGNSSSSQLVGCEIVAGGSPGACIHVNGGSPALRRNRLTGARWGAVIIGADEGCLISQNEFIGMGEDGLVIVDGAASVSKNKFEMCGGAGVRICGEASCVLEANEIRDCLVGLQVMSSHSKVELLGKNRLMDNGLSRDDQMKIPSNIELGGPEPKRRSRLCTEIHMDNDTLFNILASSDDFVELQSAIRVARHRGSEFASSAHKACCDGSAMEQIANAISDGHSPEYVQSLFACAATAHIRLVKLCKDLKESKPKRWRLCVPPSTHEVAIAQQSWDGRPDGFIEGYVAVHCGETCEILSRDPSGWVEIRCSNGQMGWCNPHVFD